MAWKKTRQRGTGICLVERGYLMLMKNSFSWNYFKSKPLPFFVSQMCRWKRICKWGPSANPFLHVSQLFPLERLFRITLKPIHYFHIEGQLLTDSSSWDVLTTSKAQRMAENRPNGIWQGMIAQSICLLRARDSERGLSVCEFWDGGILGSHTCMHVYTLVHMQQMYKCKTEVHALLCSFFSLSIDE